MPKTREADIDVARSRLRIRSGDGWLKHLNRVRASVAKLIEQTQLSGFANRDWISLSDVRKEIAATQAHLQALKALESNMQLELAKDGGEASPHGKCSQCGRPLSPKGECPNTECPCHPGGSGQCCGIRKKCTGGCRWFGECMCQEAISG